jgi:type I restriction enzyme S subunit
LFRQRRERAQEGAEQLTASQAYGVIAQSRYNEISDTRATAALSGIENFLHVDEDDFVISLRTFEGGIERAREKGCISPAYTVMRPSAQVEPGFFHYLLKSSAFIQTLQTTVTGIRDGKSVRYDQFADLVLPAPDLETQKTIADYLDRETARIDQLIEKKERLIGVLRLSHASATLREMKSGFHQLDYDVKKSRVEFLGLKSDWKRMRIKQLVRHMTSGSRAWGEQIQQEGELFLQSGCIKTMMGVSTEGAPRVTPQHGTEADRARVKNQDVLVCITGGRTGAVGFVSELKETAYINQHVCLIRVDQKKVIPKLLAQILFSEIGQVQFRMAQYGLKQGLGFAEVANVAVPCPPFEIQESICDAIDTAHRRLEVTTGYVLRSIDRLREFRSALITAAVTGQIDVSTWSRRGSTDRRLDQIEEEMST